MSNLAEKVAQLIQEASIKEATQLIESEVRAAPRSYEHRWALFQMVCLERDWTRALKQLQVIGEVRPDLKAEIYTLRALIQCETQREKVFKGIASPGFVFDTVDWMQLLLQAIQCQVDGNIAEADRLRFEAFDKTPNYVGAINGKAFDWLSDMDSRLGAVVELFSVGNYRWCGFNEIIALQFEPPKSLLDIIWRKVRCELIDSSIIYAYIPVRYPVSLELPEAALNQLARTTDWREEGETLVQGVGQRIWRTNQGEFPILECQELVVYKEVQDEKVF